MAGPKILYLDIETTPSLGYVWGMWEQDVIEMVQDWFILSYSYKWENSKIETLTLKDFPGYSKAKIDDKRLMGSLWKLIDEADIIVAHNGDNFDLKKINARFLVHGFKPPAPYKTIDTLKIARKHFKFDSNRLDDLARYLGLGRKLATKGKNTWLGCMAGDKAAWALMARYNAQDIVLLEGIYDALSPWAATLPNAAAFVGKDNVCPKPGCGKKTLQKRGVGQAGGGEHQRFQCTSCGRWSRGSNKKVVNIR